MYFKSSFHKELFVDYVRKLNSADRYYQPFAYVASAIQKKQLIDALNDHEIDYEKLQEIAGVWSSSEKAMLELAYQLFAGRNLFEYNDETPRFPTIDSILHGLDETNVQVVMQGLTMKYA